MFGTFLARFFQPLESRAFSFSKPWKTIINYTFKRVLSFQCLEPSSPKASPAALRAMEDKMQVGKAGCFGAGVGLIFLGDVVQIVTV